MIKFWIMLLFYFVGIFVFFFYFGGKKYKIIKSGGKAKEMPQRIQKNIELGFKVFFRFIGLGIFLLVLLPMIKDIPSLLNSRFVCENAYIDSVDGAPFGKWYFKQDVIFNKKMVQFYFNEPLKENHVYRLEYLEHSRFGISAKEI